MFTIEAKDKFGWYDHASFETIEQARKEVKTYFDKAYVKRGNVKIIDVSNQIEVEL